MSPEFHFTIFIAKPADIVWKALTEKDTVDRYHMAPLHTLELKHGGQISYGSANSGVRGEIVEFEAPVKLVHTFHFIGSTEGETRVAYEIEPIGDLMCALRVSHTGFQPSSQVFADISGGWPVILSSLKTLLETGQGLPWPKVGEACTSGADL